MVSSGQDWAAMCSSLSRCPSLLGTALSPCLCIAAQACSASGPASPPRQHPRLPMHCATSPALTHPPPSADAIELDYALVEDAGWGPGIGMTPGRMTPGRSPGHQQRASPSQLASPSSMSPFNDNIMFSPLGDMGGIMFSPGAATSPGYR